MNAMPLVITAIALFVLAYRFYFSFIAAKVLTLDDSRVTPAGRLYDGQNYVPMSKWVLFGHHKTLTILLAGYGFIASVLPVWLLLSPRDYLSSIMKISVIAMLAVGIIIVAPTLKMPAFTPFVWGGGPIIKGPLYPYLFITIALTIGTTYIINNGKIRYAWVTIVPLMFVGITTFIAGIMNMTGIYLPQAISSEFRVNGIINLALTLIIMASVVIILKDAIPGWILAWKRRNELNLELNK